MLGFEYVKGKTIPTYICELCDKNGHIDDLLKHPEEGNNNSNGLSTTKDDHATGIEDNSTRIIDESKQKVVQYRPDTFSIGAMDCSVEKALSKKKMKILCVQGF